MGLESKSKEELLQIVQAQSTDLARLNVEVAAARVELERVAQRSKVSGTRRIYENLVTAFLGLIAANPEGCEPIEGESPPEVRVRVARLACECALSFATLAEEVWKSQET